ncbi:hypothetical protein FQN54_000264 [Arachnomyces sp. PD_36]|nr:hypothetical protein FQN54_000264 [Arachnomyces sp. PD_36]
MSTTTLPVAQAAAITGSAFLAGGILSLSVLSIPTLAIPAKSTTKLTPGTPIPHLTHQWLYLYGIGSSIAPKLALVCSTTFAYLGYTARSTGTTGASALLRSRPASTTSNLYYLAAVFTIGIAPFTLGVMWPTNTKLKEFAEREPVAEGTYIDEKVEKQEVEEVQGLLNKWTNLNIVRGILPLVGAAVGAAAALV